MNKAWFRAITVVFLWPVCIKLASPTSRNFEVWIYVTSDINVDIRFSMVTRENS